MQLTLSNDIIYSKDTDEASVIHSKSDNIETMAYDKTEEVIEENLKGCESYIDSPVPIKKGNNKSFTGDDECFQYAATVVSNYK